MRTPRRARDGSFVLVALIGFVLIALATRVHIRSKQLSTTDTPTPRVVAPRTVTGNRDKGNASHPNHGALDLNWHWIGLAFAMLVLAFALLAVGWFVGRQRRRGRGRRLVRPELPPDLIEPAAVEDAVQRLGTAADTSLRRLAGGAGADAVIACWMSVEELALALGFERRPADTATQLADRLVARLAVDPGALRALAALYAEARFSTHPMDPGDLDRARNALQRLRASAPAVSVRTGADG